ncbi:MAG: putative hydrolase, partial [Ilumatobacteraceae bacterium]|nr:putative hydrolase [Ilumatobacteraceae bacterium]
EGPADDGNPIGMPEAELTLRVDVSAYIERKRASIMSHVSQVTDTGTFLAMPDEVFAVAFGTEWFIERGAEPGLRDGFLFP